MANIYKSNYTGPQIDEAIGKVVNDELQEKLTAGSNITISDNTISATVPTIPSIVIANGTATTPTSDTVAVISGETASGHTITNTKVNVATQAYVDKKGAAANPTESATSTLTKLNVGGTVYSIPQATTVTQDTGTSTTAVMSQKATTDALSNKQAILTSVQLNAVNSGITATKVSTYDGYSSTINGKVTANSSITGATKTKITYDSKGLVTGGSDLTATDIPSLAASKITTGTFSDARIASATTWNSKYTKPNTGIPKADLASAVQTSLEKADTALQEHQSLDSKQDTLVSGTNIKTINSTSLLGSGNISVPTLSGNNIFTGTNQMVNLRLIDGSSVYGTKLNFGDSEYVYLYEGSDDILTIYGRKGVNLNTASDGSVSVNGVAINNVVANPTSSGTVDLTKLQVGSTIYNIPSGGTTTDLSNYVDLTSAQTITGVKTFSNNIKANNGITVTNYLTVSNISSNGYYFTFPSKSGTFALSSDIKIKSATLSGDTLTLTI